MMRIYCGIFVVFVIFVLICVGLFIWFIIGRSILVLVMVEVNV